MPRHSVSGRQAGTDKEADRLLALTALSNSACSVACVPAGFIVGFVCGILGVTGTGIGVMWNPDDVAGSFSYGANWAWYQSNYE